MYDLFVIGAGSGGVRSARLAAAQGFSVGIAESSRVGGTCVIRGCVPKKLMVHAAEFSQYFSDSEGYGWTIKGCLLYTSPSPRDPKTTRMPSSA